ncbi:MAG: hypothetical protein E7553_05030 [Ruminococcaceae bacterium]|nr:hypothetical protein [Oscillospiraceae bacterium]
MISFYDISVGLRAVFLTAQFLTLCFGVYLIPKVMSQPRMLSKIVVPIGVFISGALLVVYSADIRSEKMHMELPALTKWLCEQPIIGSVLLLAAVVGYFVSVLVRLDRYHIITRSAIKESVDQLPVGLCFYSSGGRVILVNHRMNALCYALTGNALQNAEEFRRMLQNGEITNACVCLETGETPTFRLPDGCVWMFVCENLNGIVQLSATEITQIHEMTDELKSKRQDLDIINRRLRQYGENVDELARTKERLETKANIHRELGRALLITRKFVLGSTDQTPFDSWETLVAVLRAENTVDEKDLFEEFLTAAQQAGVHVRMAGTLPECDAVKTLFVSAAVEALVNAVRHAEATELYVDIAERDVLCIIRFSNNGANPTGPVMEGGGLGALRVKAEAIGGFMKTESEPTFALTLTLPMRKGGNACIV